MKLKESKLLSMIILGITSLCVLAACKKDSTTDTGTVAVVTASSTVSSAQDELATSDVISGVEESIDNQTDLTIQSIGGFTTFSTATPTGQPPAKWGVVTTETVNGKIYFVRNSSINFGTNSSTTDAPQGGDAAPITIVQSGEISTKLYVPVEVFSQTLRTRPIDPKLTAGAFQVIVFKNYVCNDVKMNGTRTVTTKSATENAVEVLKEVDITLTFSDTKNATYKSSRTIKTTWTFAGTVTKQIPQMGTDIVTGTDSGTDRNGVAFVSVINSQKPLTRKPFWPFFVAGSVDRTAGGKTATLDFGDGTIDRKATVTVDGKTETIKLNRGFKKE